MQKRKQAVNKLEVMIPIEIIENRIYLIRGHRVILDRDLAGLYSVPTKRLKEQVRRNLKRFPADFMFELTWEEAVALASRSQVASLKKGQNVKYLPYAFTEQGVAMLSSVLHSDRAIDVNIQIMRVFVRLKELMISHKDLVRKIEDLEGKFVEHDKKFILVFEAIRHFLLALQDIGPCSTQERKSRVFESFVFEAKDTSYKSEGVKCSNVSPQKDLERMFGSCNNQEWERRFGKKYGKMDLKEGRLRRRMGITANVGLINGKQKIRISRAFFDRIRLECLNRRNWIDYVEDYMKSVRLEIEGEYKEVCRNFVTLGAVKSGNET